MSHFTTHSPASALMRGSAGLALCCALLAGQAQAQAQDQAQDQAPATATNGATNAGGLEDIVVTAQFRSQALQDTPLAITAMSGDMLTQRNITSFADVGATAPSVSLRPAAGAFGKATTAYIRGVGQGDFNYAYEPAVGIYIDDVYYSTLYGSTFDLLDLDRVEILRGPQGTLFGKNSIGGAVRLISRKPKGDNSGFAEVTYGSYDRLDLRAAFDLGVTDNLAMRVSGVSKTRKGYVHLVDFTCERPAEAGSIPSTIGGPGYSGKNCNIGRLGGDDTQAARVAFRWTPTPELEINLTGDYMKDNSEATANTLIAADPDTVRFAAWNSQVNIPQFGVPFDSRFVPDDPYKSYATFLDPVNGTVSPRHSPIESWGTALTLDYQLSDDLSFKSITGYRKYNASFSYDQDNSPLQYQNVLSELGHRQFSQELRLTGKALADALDFTVGGFYFDSHSTLDGPVQINGTTTSFVQNDQFDTSNKSAFVHLTYSPVDALEFVGGLRYTHETKSNLFNHIGQLSVPKVTQSYNRWDWRGGINYHLTDDVMFYGQVSTGYRSGGFNPRPFSAAQLVSFGPESLTAYEVGAKTEMFDRRLRFNVAGYISKYKDRLITIQSVDSDGLALRASVQPRFGDDQGYRS